jgi:4-hydroxy-3-polyprenylbenzoate decarboxylase
MAYNGLADFAGRLDAEDELLRIKSFADPSLVITEITDRIVKSGGRALLFENNGTTFPLLINMFGSEKRMAMAMGRSGLDDAGLEITQLFNMLREPGRGLAAKIKMLPALISMARISPRRMAKRGKCQEVIMDTPDLSLLPVLRCWPWDGGPFITLPVVHTRHPDTGEVNAGMYRMQVMGNTFTGMHWHRHKTGANHFRAWKERGERMPVTVTLGGDPVYTYAATAPLPEGMDEYLLAGFLRGKRVKMVKSLTNDLWIPADADIVIEGYVDPDEEPVWEGPFGDHTGFYSLADWYPAFHVTAVTHRKNALYPATIVGIPPMEDSVIGKATERLFLHPIKMTIQPDITGMHMPPAGVAHNLVLVKIDKKYPGQGVKVMSALFGAGQMMFSKYIIVVDDDAVLTDYREIMERVLRNVSLPDDLLITRGPLDVLDHAASAFSYGGKMGIDATVKMDEERGSGYMLMSKPSQERAYGDDKMVDAGSHYNKGRRLETTGGTVLILPADNPSLVTEEAKRLGIPDDLKWVLLVDPGVDTNDLFTVSWQVLSNCDPARDILIADGRAMVDATPKTGAGLPRAWPNVVVSLPETIEQVDMMWKNLGAGEFIKSPSLKYSALLLEGKAEAERVQQQGKDNI